MLVNAVVVFIVLWWVTLFIVLPIKVEVEEEPQVGCASSAPSKAYMTVKFMLTTVIAGVLTAIYCFLKVVGILNLEYLYGFVP